MMIVGSRKLWRLRGVVAGPLLISSLVGAAWSVLLITSVTGAAAQTLGTSPTAAPAPSAPATTQAPVSSGPPASGRASPVPAAAPSAHGAGKAEDPLADTAAADPALPVGSLSAQIVNDQNQPVPGQAVRLAIHFESIAEGQEDKEQTAQTDRAGRVQFDRLAIGSKYNYRILTQYAGAEYSSESVNLGPDMGIHMRLHVFPSTGDLSLTRITTRALYSIEPRDEVFQVQALIRLSNHGPLTFKPQGFNIRLPEGAKAFTDDSKLDQKFQESSGVARLSGSFTPYRHHDLKFRFQIPNTNEARQSFTLGLLPNAIESRVIVEKGRGMQLEVQGYGEVKEDAAPDGRAIIWAQNIASRDGERREAEVVISGLPTVGPLRIWIVALALAMALLGVRAARLNQAPDKAKADPDRAKTELEQAQAVLLQELQALERARDTSEIGPKTYERAREALILALVQLRQQLNQRPG